MEISLWIHSLTPPKSLPFPRRSTATPRAGVNVFAPSPRITGGPAGAHLGSVVVQQPLVLARLETEATVEVPQPWHVLQGQGQVAVAVDTD